MKAFTVRNPHAALIAAELKLVESKPRATKYRGEIAIHAGKFFNEASHHMFYKLAERYSGVARLYYGVNTLHFGAIIATAELYDCIPAEQLTLTDMERAFGDYSTGRYGWLLRNIKRLDAPVYCKGQLGLWNWNFE